MKKSTFSLFQSHLDLVHRYWAEVIKEGDVVVDATCGNGRDTLRLAKLGATLYSVDIQEQALKKAKELATTSLTEEQLKSIHWVHGCHSVFPEELKPQTVKAIIYNLGYLPGGDKSITTLTQTTLKSIEGALLLLAEGGMITLTAYPGHAEGALENQALLAKLSALDPNCWNICHHRWINRVAAPELFLIQKKV